MDFKGSTPYNKIGIWLHVENIVYISAYFFKFCCILMPQNKPYYNYS